MPQPGFQPIIGGGFDQDAAQTQGWAGFNAQMDQANIGRANAADQAWNNWRSQLAQRQAEETARQDAMSMRDQQNQVEAAARAAEQASRAYEFGQSEAEKKREFDADQALKQKHYEFQQKTEQDSKDNQQQYINDLGDNAAPHVQATGAAHEKAQRELEQATQELKDAQATWQERLPGSRWNPKTGQFERVNAAGKVEPWPEELQGTANNAMKDMNAAQTYYLKSAQEAKDAQAAWNDTQKRYSSPEIFPVRREDGVWGLHSPVTKKSYFAKLLDKEKAKAAAAPGTTPTTATATAPPADDTGAGDEGSGEYAWFVPQPSTATDTTSPAATSFAPTPAPPPAVAPAAAPPATTASAPQPAPNDLHSAAPPIPGQTYLVIGRPMVWNGNAYVGKGPMGETTTVTYNRFGYLQPPPNVPETSPQSGWTFGMQKDPTTGNMTHTMPPSYPPVPANPKDRVYGQVYSTPKGDYQWQGSGWGMVPAT